MSKNNKIFGVIEADIEHFRKDYRAALIGERGSKLDFVSYILKSEGKGIRPTLLLLAAHLHGETNQTSINSAIILELTHNASLIHDDVVDEAYQRRNRFSINALWRSKKAVLVGDYVFSKAILTASRNELYYVLEDVAKVIEEMSLGEIEQSDATLKLDITEGLYYEIIRRKTASLMSCAARLGARSTGADEQQQEKMSRLGDIIGVMFQIKDDILDFTGNNSGKKTGNDLKEKKITLPLIYALRKGEKKEVNSILKLLRKGGREAQIEAYVHQKKGIELSQSKIEAMSGEAKDIVMSYPPSPYRDALIDLIDFIIDRDN